MNKRGLNDIVTTVLIIMVGIIAIGLLYTFVISPTRGAGNTLDKSIADNYQSYLNQQAQTQGPENMVGTGTDNNANGQGNNNNGGTNPPADDTGTDLTLPMVVEISSADFDKLPADIQQLAYQESYFVLEQSAVNIKTLLRTQNDGTFPAPSYWEDGSAHDFNNIEYKIISSKKND